MSPGELRILEFIETRLDSLVYRPSLWGSLHSVEDQVLQLLELRRVLVDPRLGARDTGRLMQDYVAFIATLFPEPTPEPLAAQLEALGRTDEFAALLGGFVADELVAHVAGASEPTALELPTRLEIAERVFEQVRAQVTNQLRRDSRSAQAIPFPANAGPR